MTDELSISSQDVKVIVVSGVTNIIVETEVVTDAISSPIVESGIVTVYEDITTYIEDKNEPPTLINSLSVGPQGPISDSRVESFNSNVTSSTVVDFVFTNQVAYCKWTLYIEGDIGNRELIEILAFHDGTQINSATVPIFTIFTKLQLGTITDLNVSVELVSEVTQQMQLLISSAMSIDVWSVRESIKW